MIRLVRIWILASVLTLLLVVNTPAQQIGPLVLQLTADGPVAPAMSEYLSRGIKVAEAQGAEILIFQLNTPGGSIDSMEDMVQAILDSTVPVVVYIAPRGAMAASAGTLVTLAGHAAAMAPETTIGAASPVGAEGQDLGQTMEAKVKEALKAKVRSLAERRGSDAVSLAEEMIQSAKAVSANEAIEVKLIDFIAKDIPDLLRQLDGFTVEMKNGRQMVHTTNAVVHPLPSSFIEQLLATLTNPNIVFLLLTIGVQAILIELSSPGGWVAGFIGVVCLALATYGLGVLPVNWFGLVFLATAFVLFILDIKAPTHGALTTAGIASLIVGALVLFNSPTVPRFQRVSVPLVVGTSIITGALFVTILIYALRAQRIPIRTGQESLVGRVGRARINIDPFGTVQIGGELWSAELDEDEAAIPAGTRVQVTRVQGIHLFVRKNL
jgi:membrane-bound serine protease (ClpP class)